MGQVSEKPAIAWSSVTMACHIIAVPRKTSPETVWKMRTLRPTSNLLHHILWTRSPRVLFSSKLEMHCLEHRPRGNPPMAEIPPPPPTLKTIHLQHFIITGQAENWRDMEKSRCAMKHEVAGYYRNPILIHKTIRPWKVIAQQSRTKC